MMMRYFTRSIAIIFIGISLFSGLLTAQDVDRWNALDPFMKHTLRNDGIQPEMFRSGNFPEIIDTLFDESQEPEYHLVIHGSYSILEQLEIQRNTKLQDFSTSHVDLRTLHRIAGQSGVKLIEYGAPMEILMDESRSDIRADMVNEGDDLERAYTGQGVIVGVIDTGIDIYHPDFLAEDPGNGTRIISVWDTTFDPENDETNPSGFDYGVEYTKADIDATLDGSTDQPVRTRDSNGHGTHVAGIAAGNGNKGDGAYTGIAPQAGLVVVRVPSSGISTAVVIDGLNYIFSLADEMQKPAVVNLSIGGHGGAHDGTASHEKAITQLVKEAGRVVIVAAGNSGGSDIHSGGVLAPSEQTTISMTVNEYSPDNTNYLINLLWYENLDEQGLGPLLPAETMNLSIESPNGHTASVNSGSGTSEETDDGKIIIESYGKNEKNARLFYLELTDTEDGIHPESGTWNVTLEHASGEGNVQYNMWQVVSTTAANVTLEPSTGREHTVTIPGTSEGAVTVGSYTSKNTWTDINGSVRSTSATVGELSWFSGGGPTRDGRLKPEMSAPGQMIAAALSDDASFPSSRQVEPSGYVVLEGTSMASPHIAGTTALLFEVDPALDTEQIKQKLYSSGRSDDYTGSLPNNAWGHGKVDAYDAVVAAGAVVRVTQSEPGIPENYFVEQNYPNPFNPVTTIRYGIASREHVTLRVYNTLGQLISEPVNNKQEAGYYEVHFDAAQLPSGVYFYRIEAGEFIKTMRATLLR